MPPPTPRSFLPTARRDRPLLLLERATPQRGSLLCPQRACTTNVPSDIPVDTRKHTHPPNVESHPQNRQPTAALSCARQWISPALSLVVREIRKTGAVTLHKVSGRDLAPGTVKPDTPARQV